MHQGLYAILAYQHMCIGTCVDSLTSMPPLTQDYIWGEAVQMLSEVGQVVVNVWPLENLLHLFLNSQQT